MQEAVQHHTFPATPWSLIARAGLNSADTVRAALDTLLPRYLPALRAHLISHRRLNPDLADDILQGFVSRKVLEQKLIAHSDRARGKFRSFLLKALNNFLIDQLRAQQARGGVHAAIDDVDEQNFAADDDSHSAAFDREWARQVIDEAVRRMRWECDRAGRPDLWGVFEQRVLAPSLSGAQPASYEKLIEEFGLRSPTQASNVLMTAKRMFARTLRGVLFESAEDENEIDDDLRDLKRIFADS